ncbi:MAG: OmpA family protein [Candidatus Carbobacillus altaicus]|uniref:Flagellar motor rotation protein MotB n=1 Tax=Candidatus Carbonibacillus altaicus TaxID=2163959 RepID=A0A2R6Y362_9BACL|nr:OmpA family protein [Candidatus Carbobacillus altaicus]PTQ57126.1 MAG: Flagellar motor rotation protein MotB [Candidatus Carbobacillus altaicus]
MKKRKRSHDEERIDETWLIPYSDLLTLLLALFIVLFAMSEIDANKVAKLANAFNIAFQGGSGVLEFEQPVKPQDTLPYVPRRDPTDEHNLSSDPEKTARVNPEDKAKLERIQQEVQALQTIQNAIQTYVSEHGLTDYISTIMDNEGLKILIGERALFPSGSAALTKDALSTVEDISMILEQAYPRHISIIGHTDNVPIHTAQFPSNWELSVTRAANFLQALLKNPKLDPSTFRIIGYGEFKPVADNRTPEGRAQNRRVEVVIDPLISLVE